MLSFIIVLLHIFAIPVFFATIGALIFSWKDSIGPIIPSFLISTFIILFVSRQHFKAFVNFIKKRIPIRRYIRELVSSVIKKFGWFFIIFFFLGLFSMAGSKTDTEYGGWIVIVSLVLYCLTNWIHKKLFQDEIMD